jgi:phage terminase large subunit-like protein
VTAICANGRIEAYGGFDLGRSDDWAARAIIARVDGETIDNAVWQLHVETWAAEDGSIDLRQHPYRQWVSEGLVNVCTGDAIDYDTIEQQIAADDRELQYRAVAI